MQEQLQALLQEISKSFDVNFEPLTIDGRELRLLNIVSMSSYLNRLISTGAIEQPLRDLPLWAKTWPGAIILGRFLRNFPSQGKTLLELGCGTASLSLIASFYGFAKLTVTDIEQNALKFAQANVLANKLEHLISVKRLDVRQPHLEAGQYFDIIAAAELLYLDELHRPLLKFLARHLAKTGKAFFCTDRKRLKPGFHKLAAKCFKISERNIGVKNTDDAGQEERRIYNILILEKQ